MIRFSFPVSAFRHGPSLRLAALGAGFFVTVLGLAALVGWHARIPLLTQVLPHLVPMQYNTALGFVLCGASLLLATLGCPRAGAVLAAPPAVAGAVTLLEYATGADLGIDQLLMMDYLAIQISYPGRMAWMTAVCFLLFAVQGVTAGWSSEAAGRVRGLVAAVLLGLGLASIAGYIGGLFTLYVTGDATRMAVLTALCFSFMGAGLLALERGQGRSCLDGLPLFASVFFMSLTMSLGQSRGGETRAAVFEVVLGVLAGVAVFYARKFRLEADQLAFHRAHLEELVAERTQTLHERELFLRAAVQGANIGMFDWRVPSDTVRYSAEWKKMLGCAEEEIRDVFEEWSSRLHPEDRDEILAAMRAQLKKPVPEFELVFRLRHQDGSYRWIISRASVSLGLDGRVERIVGVHLDITDIKNSEERNRHYARRAVVLLDLAQISSGLDEREFLRHGLAQIEGLTESTVSFLHFVNDDQESVELVAWSRQTLDEYCTAVHAEHYLISEAGIWADAFRLRAPVVCNDYATAPNRRGLPPGHAPLERFLCVPVIENGVVRMMAGVGNKTAPYTDLERETVQLMANTIWSIVRQRRMERIAADHQSRLRSTLDGLSAHIALLDDQGVILLVNSGWRTFAQDNDIDPALVSEGASYARVCANALGEDRETAVAFGEGLRDVLSGARGSFLLEYPCHSPHVQRWFAGRITATSGLGRRQVIVAHEDITARRLVEDELKQSMAETTRLREALEQVFTLVYIKDTASQYVYANRQTLDLFGCTLADLIGSDDARFFPPETVLRLREIDLRVFAGERIAEEVEVPGEDGGRVYWEVKTPIRDEAQGGAITGLLGISTDITERKRIESKLRRDLRLRQSQARLYTSLVRSDVSIRDFSGIVLEEARGLIGCRHGYVGTIGQDSSLLMYTQARMVDTCAVDSPDQTIFPCDAGGVYPSLWGVSLNTRQPFFTNTPSQHEAARGLPAGHLELESFLSVPVSLGSRLVGQISLANKPGGFDAEDLDAMVQIAEFYALVIQRLAAQRALKNEKELQEKILDGICAGIIVAHPRTWIVEDVNRNLLWLVGRRREDVVGLEFNALGWQSFGGQDVAAREALLAAVSQREFRLSRRDGSFLPVSATLISTQIDGVEKMLIIVFDVSRQKDLERQLLLAQKMESLGQLAAGIAHEINTPSQYVSDNLHFIADAFGSFTSLLAQAREHELDEVCQRLWAEYNVDFLLEEVPLALSQSLEGVGRISTIVQAMKRFSHPGSEQRDAVNVNEAIRTTATVSRNAWKYHAELVMNLDPDLPFISGFGGDLNQVFLNVLVNGTQAIEQKVAGTGEKGCLTVTTRLVKPWVEIRFADTGCGIAPENLPRIFDPFFTTKPVGQGTGQGLAISYQIVVVKHGGHIEYQSALGQGAECIIRLPIAELGPANSAT